MSNNRFTIITVCYNAEKDIQSTINSVLSQSFQDYEYIIKDGQSTDKTMEYIQEYTENNDCIKVLRGKDKGIYDAMNIAVQEAIGEYILFLNAGDTFVNKEVLTRVDRLIEEKAADIYYGDVLESDGKNTQLRTYSAKNSKLWYYSLGACLCHQTMFCKRALFERRLFDLDYLVCADREWQMELISNGAKTAPLKIAISKVLLEGFSSKNVEILERETRTCVKTYCGFWYGAYVLISAMKRFSYMRRIIHNVEMFFAHK